MTGPLRLGSLCTGYAGLDMSIAQVLDVELTWVADPDPGAAAILAHHWPHVPNLGDITAVDWSAVPPVDVVCGGYPCQPFSLAGHRKGTADERHLWPYIATALRVLRPKLAVFENVANHLRIGFDQVLRDLAALGFDAEWITLRASEVGAAHPRSRLIFITWPADADRTRLERARLPRETSERRRTPAHPPRDGRHARRPEPARLVRRPDAALGRHAAANSDSDALRQQPVPERRSGGTALAELDGVNWGAYRPAIDRWARILGRPAPDPTEPGPRGRRRLSPVFVEWLMGLPKGHVTAVPGLTRNQQLQALGNGVVPQQGAAAVSLLLDRIEDAA